MLPIHGDSRYPNLKRLFVLDSSGWLFRLFVGGDLAFISPDPFGCLFGQPGLFLRGSGRGKRCLRVVPVVWRIRCFPPERPDTPERLLMESNIGRVL